MTGFDAYGCGVQGASSEVLDVSSMEALTLDARMGQARLARTLSGLAALDASPYTLLTPIRMTPWTSTSAVAARTETAGSARRSGPHAGTTLPCRSSR
jgi:hypothetical protein